jgi:hypothetical protein
MFHLWRCFATTDADDRVFENLTRMDSGQRVALVGVFAFEDVQQSHDHDLEIEGETPVA